MNVYVSPEGTRGVPEFLHEHPLSEKTYRRVLEEVEHLSLSEKAGELTASELPGFDDLDPTVLAHEPVGKVWVYAEEGETSGAIPGTIEVARYNDRGIELAAKSAAAANTPGNALGHISFQKIIPKGEISGLTLVLDSEEIQTYVMLLTRVPFRIELFDLDDLRHFAEKVGLADLWHFYIREQRQKTEAPIVSDDQPEVYGFYANEPIGRDLVKSLQTIES